MRVEERGMIDTAPGYFTKFCEICVEFVRMRDNTFEISLVTFLSKLIKFREIGDTGDRQLPPLKRLAFHKK